MKSVVDDYGRGKAPCDNCGRSFLISDLYVDETFGETLCEECYGEGV